MKEDKILEIIKSKDISRTISSLSLKDRFDLYNYLNSGQDNFYKDIILDELILSILKF